MRLCPQCHPPPGPSAPQGGAPVCCSCPCPRSPVWKAALTSHWPLMNICPVNERLLPADGAPSRSPRGRAACQWLEHGGRPGPCLLGIRTRGQCVGTLQWWGPRGADPTSEGVGGAMPGSECGHAFLLGEARGAHSGNWGSRPKIWLKTMLGWERGRFGAAMALLPPGVASTPPAAAPTSGRGAHGWPPPSL